MKRKLYLKGKATNLQYLHEQSEGSTLSRGVIVSWKVKADCLYSIVFQLQHGKEHAMETLQTDVPHLFHHLLCDDQLTCCSYNTGTVKGCEQQSLVNCVCVCARERLTCL